MSPPETVTSHAPLIAALRSQAITLGERAVEEMYRNPFWEARFGERGRKFASEDGQYHLRYLCQALDDRNPQVMRNYVQWLQGVLTARGMCTRHLEENFLRLRRLISEHVASSLPAQAMLDEAVAALRYALPAPLELQQRTDALAERATVLCAPLHPEWSTPAGAAGRERCVDDGRYHLSYLADSLALARPELFTAYVQWVAGFLERFHVPPAHLRRMLEAISQAIAEGCSAETLAACRSRLDAACAVLPG